MINKSARIRFNYKKVLVVAGAVILIFVVIPLFFLYLTPAYSQDPLAHSFIKTAVDRQQKIEQELRATYQAGQYTFTAPLVIQNPYQTAPLTALLIFDTPENSQISVHVPGKTPEAALDYTFQGFQSHHEISVYGLYAGMLNHVTVSLKTQSGENAQIGIDLQTEPLPVSVQNFTVDTLNRAKYSLGFNFAFLDRKPAFDLDGNVRWYSTQKSFQVFTKLENGRFLFTYSTAKGDSDGNILMEQDLLGKIYTIYNVANGIHHDIYELPTGNLLLTSSDLKSDTIEDYIIEINRSNGHIIRSFDLKKYLDAYRPGTIDTATNDWLHVNSIVYDPTDGSIIISSRSQSVVIKMTYPGMQIKWILGPHDNWGPKYQPYLLTPVGDYFEWFWSQHHATLYGPNMLGDNSVDILLFDNGLYRSFDLASAYSPPEWYSRIVHYRINEASMTVEQVWEYGKKNGPGVSKYQSSAYLLPNGNILGTWAAIAMVKGTETKTIELDPSNSNVVFESTVLDVETYRAMRTGLYEGYSEKNNYLSTSLNDTSGNDLVDRSVMAWQDFVRWTNMVLLVSLKRLARRIFAVVN